MEPNDYLQELNTALQEYRFHDIQSLTNLIEPAAFQSAQIKKALGLIRRKRLFPELERVASLFQMSGKSDPIIRRQWSQALLDQNRVTQALTILEPMSKDLASDPVEGPEVRGLIGRAYKQHYINEGNPDYLRSAISAYLPDWESRQGDYRWQGINLVALLSRAQHDGVDPGHAVNSFEIARSILEDINERGAAGVWDYATAMEAAIALEDQAEALAWMKKYVQHPDTDAFELASTLRQLKEVWCLDGTAIGNRILPVLEYELLQREGESVQPMHFDKIHDEAGFEAVWGGESYVRVEWFETLYSCFNAIARVSNTATGEPIGTGFLVTGSSLNVGWGSAPVFLTNSHVVSANPGDGAPLYPADASAEFTRLVDRPKVRLGETLFCSPPGELDVSIFRLEAPSGSRTLDPYPYLPKVGSEPNDSQRIYVIGHPGGTELAVSLYDNRLAEYERQYVRYRSPTEGGHSGSPVLTRQLKTFAVHHRALYDRQLNEGILLKDIISYLQNTTL